ncbi:glycosyltransferase [Psychromonas sp. MME2]|uniref:glycosyltransferase family 2 protein n=1 Tax=unclassified Psychromonas TaxID=2614957 RepID=UPI00339BFF86
MNHFAPCFIIPCYNHGRMLPAVVATLCERYNHPIIIIDDGSDIQTKNALLPLLANHTVITLATNQGKGAAVIAGIKRAAQLGYSHAIQIDADGQHDLDALSALLSEAEKHPQALISGCPVYDQSIPKARLYGRYITHFWVWVETLSFSIKDSMCGFRAYPIAATIALINHCQLGLRMDFDTEIMVRLYWADCDVRFINTKVIYPEDGISHFHAFKDNVQISKMHSKLFFAMLTRIPKLLTRHKRLNQQRQQHWSKQSERGTYYGIKLLLAAYSLFGRNVFKMFLAPVLFYYSLTAKETKHASSAFLQQIKIVAKKSQLNVPQHLTFYRHINSFALTILDKLAAWKGDFCLDNLTIHGKQQIDAIIASGKGAVILGSHLGNLELCRALSQHHQQLKINALVFTANATRFNTVMKAVNPKSELNIIQVDKLGPETAILLAQKIEAGEWVVIVGDRTSTRVEHRAVWADFLDKPAPFPQGPFILAALLKAPVYLLFALRNESKKEAHFDLYFEHFSDAIDLPRGKREQALQNVVQRYATRLQFYAMKAPLQWYNFFDFWHLSGKRDDK